MKKIWKYAILLVALSALLCMSAFAADGLTVNSFVQVDGVDAVKAVDGKEYFTATYQGNAGSQYLILMLATETVPESQPEGTAMPDPTDGNILYINQAQADEKGVVKFETVYPMALEDSVIWLTGGPEAVALASIDVAKKEVSVTIIGTDNKAQAKVSADGNTLNVQNNEACVVIYTTDNGKTYKKLTATVNVTGGYDYDLTQVPAGAEISVAVKGDANGDGTVTSADSVLLSRSLLLSSHPAYKPLDAMTAMAFDLNNDGDITSADSVLLSRNLLLDTHAAYKALTW